MMVCGLNFSWKINVNEPTSNRTHVVLLLLDIPLIRYETFPDAWAHRKSMILRVEFNDIRVEDHVLSSAYRNMFTFDAPPSKKNNKEAKPPQNVSAASLTVTARKGYGDIVYYSTKVIFWKLQFLR